jgi:hypothetical protein
MTACLQGHGKSQFPCAEWAFLTLSGAKAVKFSRKRTRSRNDNGVITEGRNTRGNPPLARRRDLNVDLSPRQKLFFRPRRKLRAHWRKAGRVGAEFGRRCGRHGGGRVLGSLTLKKLATAGRLGRCAGSIVPISSRLHRDSRQSCSPAGPERAPKPCPLLPWPRVPPRAAVRSPPA